MSATIKPPSRKQSARKAEGMLLRLLRTPKTRAGLIAAVTTPGVTRNFVYGWLSDQVRSGAVAPLKSTKPPTYQIASLVIAERPPAGLYPTWLEPKFLPDTSHRQAYFDGRAANSNRKRPTK